MPLPTDAATVADTQPQTDTTTAGATDAQTDPNAGVLEDLANLMGPDAGTDDGDGDAAVTDTAADEGAAAGDDAAVDDVATAAAAAVVEKKDDAATAADAPAKVEPKPEEIEQQKQQIVAQQQHEQRVATFQADYSKIREVANGDKFDPFEHTAPAIKMLMEGLALVDAELSQVREFTQKSQAKSAEDIRWEKWGRIPENVAIGAQVGRQIFEEELAKRQAKYPNVNLAALEIAAQEAFESRIVTRRGQIAAKKTKGAVASQTTTTTARTPVRQPPVTKGGATVTPPPSVNRVPAKTPKTVEEKLEAGAYGDLSKDL